MTAGTAIIDISPKKGVQLAGYPHCHRENEGVHDQLYAACVYLDNGKTKKVFVTLDLLAIGKRTVAKIRGKFKGADITVSASHTHSGPWASEPLASEKAEGVVCDESYMAFLEKSIIDLISSSMANTFDVSVGAASVICGAERGIGGNRHEKSGVCDPSVNVIAVKDGGGTIRAILCNYSLHPTYLHAENVLVSADYPGCIRKFLGFAYPDAVFLFAQGASGNQSSRYFRNGQNFEEAARAGTALGCAVYDCIQTMSFTNEINIKAESFSVKDLPLKSYPAKGISLALVREKEKLFKEAKKAGGYIKARNAELELFGAQNAYYFSLMAENNYVSPELPCEIQVITLGDTRIVTVQGELFTEYGLEIKKIYGGNTFVFSVTNGYLPGYIYTPEAEKQGSYEAGTSMFSKNAGEVLIGALKNSLI